MALDGWYQIKGAKMSLLSFVNNIKVSKIVIITAAVPIIMAVILGGVLTYERFQAVESVTRLQALVNPIPIFSDLVHEQQKERGVTAVFLSSNGEKFVKELQDQRVLTDVKYETLAAHLAKTDFSFIDARLHSLANEARGMLAQRDEIRTKINSLEISAHDAIKYYTDLN